MRLFTAVTLEEDTKNSLYEIVEVLKNNSDHGSFTEKANLHITVNFIGETKRLEEVKKAMEQAVKETHAAQFILSAHELGKFKRKEGDIYWIGIEKDTTLWKLQKELVKQLKEAGFYDVDDKEYAPHLTLGRRIKRNDEFQMERLISEIEPIIITVPKISLMKSERIQGKLTYTEIYHILLD
jgi:2'-5' RNA ligase